MSEAVHASVPLLTGFMIHWCLFSTLSVQTYIYYEGAATTDRLLTRCLVYGVYAMECIQTGFVTYDAFAIFAFGFGDLRSLTAVHFHWLTIPIMSAFVSSISQLFYAYRIFLLSGRRRFAPCIIGFVSLTSAAAAILTGVLARIIGDASKLSTLGPSLAIGFWCGGAALCDVLIAMFMTHYLAKHDTGFRHTQRLISKLIRITVETGSLTAVGALLDLILFFAFPFEDAYMSVALWLPKLYANAMIMVINARLRIVYARGGEGEGEEGDHVHMVTTRSGVGFLQPPSPSRALDGRGTVSSVYSDMVEMKKMGDSEVGIIGV